MVKVIFPFYMLVGIFSAATCLAGTDRELDCMVKPEMYIELSSPVDGVLDSLLVETSASVKKGQVVATLESSVEAARVKLAQQEALVEHTIDSKKVELDFTERNKKRYKDMYDKESVAFYEADRANTDVALARIAHEKTLADKKTATLQLQLAIAQLEQKTIKSPITGIVVERYVMPGESVNGRAIMKLAQVDPLRVELVAPAELFGQIRKGMTVEIRPEKPANQRYLATVTSVDQLIDPASGSFKVRLALPNPDDKLVGGVNCTARFNLEKADNAVIKKSIESAADKILTTFTDLAELPNATESKTSPVALAENPTPKAQPINASALSSQCLTMPAATRIGLAHTDTSPPPFSLVVNNSVACYELGFLNCTDAEQKPAAQAPAETQRVKVNPEPQGNITGYMVFYPAAETYTQSNDNFAVLKQYANKDIHLFSKGPLRGGIALGFLTDKLAAEKLAQDFIRKGFEVQIRPQHKSEPRFLASLSAKSIR
ncbi:MAG: efflux RND transporter periplasmic adaptor subunit [Methylococcales bacterium]